MMKKKYESPEFEVILLNLADVITDSPVSPWTPGGSGSGEVEENW